MNVWLTPNLKPFVGGTYFHAKGPGLHEVLRWSGTKLFRSR
jgi:uncharacterized protein YyaL (SSP411 family)